MASPFSLFRKNQKMLLAVFGVIIMLTFVVGTPLMMFVDSSRRARLSDNSIVVTWAGGKVHENEIYLMRNSHRLVVRFLAGVVEKVHDKDGNPIAPGYTEYSNRQVRDPGIPADDSDRALIETMLLAKRAEDAGMVVTDGAIYDFLENQLGVGLLKVEDDDFARIKRDTIGDKMSEIQLFDRLRTELLAQNMRMMGRSSLFAHGMPIMPPGASWEYYKRLNRRAETEILPISIASFTSEVKAEPTPQQIRDLYEKTQRRLHESRFTGAWF